MISRMLVFLSGKHKILVQIQMLGLKQKEDTVFNIDYKKIPDNFDIARNDFRKWKYLCLPVYILVCWSISWFPYVYLQLDFCNLGFVSVFWSVYVIRFSVRGLITTYKFI